MAENYSCNEYLVIIRGSGYSGAYQISVRLSSEYLITGGRNKKTSKLSCNSY